MITVRIAQDVILDLLSFGVPEKLLVPVERKVSLNLFALSDQAQNYITEQAALWCK